jgi:hypothetical protein
MSAAPADDASTVRTAERDAQRAWVIGGAALAASAVIPAIMGPGTGPWVVYIGRILAFAALLLLALGVRGQGSITGRRPLGTTALIVLGALPFGMVVVSNLVLSSAVAGTSDSPNGEILTAAAVVSNVSTYATLAVAIISVVQIARAGVVPRPWNLAPLWVLAAVVGLQVLAQGTAITMSNDPVAMGVVFDLARVVHVAGYAFLGILAIVLATRPRKTDSVAVYRGAAAPD